MRFPEFSGEWQQLVLEDVAVFSNGKAHENEVSENGKYILVNSKFISTEGKIKKYSSTVLSPLYKDVIVMVMSDLPNGKALSKCFYIDRDDLYTLNQRICSLQPKAGVFSRFLFYQLNRNRYFLKFDDGINQTNLKKSEVLKCPIYIPQYSEQLKIGKLVSLLDERINTQNKIIEDLKKLKVAIRDKQLNAIRKHYGLNYQICDLLDYEQPTKYVVTDTEYSDDISKTSVLTANKAFILGYTNETFGVYDKGKCIILDDFTLDCKYVDFPFKVKSSAIKILTVKNGYSLRYVYEYINYLNLETTEHKRHYISEMEPMIIAYPTDQKKIDDFNNMMSSLESKIEIENKYLQSLLAQKSYLLSNMFI